MNNIIEQWVGTSIILEKSNTRESKYNRKITTQALRFWKEKRVKK